MLGLLLRLLLEPTLLILEVLPLLRPLTGLEPSQGLLLLLLLELKLLRSPKLIMLVVTGLSGRGGGEADGDGSGGGVPMQ